MIRSIAATLAFAAAAGSLGAQQWSVEGHGSYSRTTQTHTSSWGAGASSEATWGGQHAPVQLGTALGFDWMKQESGGPNTYSLNYDATLQPGGNSTFTPYAGGEISANWLSGDSTPSGALVGFQGILGVQIKPNPNGKTALRLEVRPGYVKTQEHSITWRLGISQSL
jgi:hypothetical protein